MRCWKLDWTAASPPAVIAASRAVMIASRSATMDALSATKPVGLGGDPGAGDGAAPVARYASVTVTLGVEPPVRRLMLG